MPFWKVLSINVLKGFDKYKYSSKDTSPLSNYVMHPFWDWLVQFVPIWVAPNLLTFVGFLMTASNFLLLAILDPDYTASNIGSTSQISPVIWFLIAVLNFAAHQLDGTDGKQARRTKTSSPLGELFDHGCDSWSVSMLPLTMISLFGTDKYGTTHWQMFLIVWAMIICFVLTHWEKYLTGILYLPWGYDFGQLGATLGCLAASICSPNIFKGTVFGTMKISSLGIYCVLISVGVFSIPIIIFNIIQSYRLKTGRMLSFSEAFEPLISILILLIGSTVWAFYSPSSVFHNHSRLFLFVLGTVSSNITVNLIISQMSQTKSELFNPFAVIYAIFVTMVIVLRNVISQWEIIILRFMCVVFSVVHVIYVVFIIRDLCDHLNIQPFSIPYHSQKDSFKKEVNHQ